MLRHVLDNFQLLLYSYLNNNLFMMKVIDWVNIFPENLLILHECCLLCVCIIIAHANLVTLLLPQIWALGNCVFTVNFQNTLHNNHNQIIVKQ